MLRNLSAGVEGPSSATPAINQWQSLLNVINISVVNAGWRVLGVYPLGVRKIYDQVIVILCSADGMFPPLNQSRVMPPYTRPFHS